MKMRQSSKQSSPRKSGSAPFKRDAFQSKSVSKKRELIVPEKFKTSKTTKSTDRNFTPYRDEFSRRNSSKKAYKELDDEPKINRRKETENKIKEKRESGVRINKYLADAGLGSRRYVENMILEGAVKINRKIVTDLSTRVLPGSFVTVNGEPVSDRKHMMYILLNKPKDTITTVSDDMDRTTVMDIVRKKTRIYPVGRLDRNTTGVLLLTNDGELAYRLTHPKFEIERVYNVTLDAPLDLQDAASISRGVELDDGPIGECEIFVNPDDRKKVALGIREGRNREVRRLFEVFGYEVMRLDRKSFATLTTRGLARGEYRNLTQNEVIELKKLVGLDKEYEKPHRSIRRNK